MQALYLCGIMKSLKVEVYALCLALFASMSLLIHGSYFVSLLVSYMVSYSLFLCFFYGLAIVVQGILVQLL